jgi:hypothetical protein
VVVPRDFADAIPAQGSLFGADPKPLPPLEAPPAGAAADRAAEPMATYGHDGQADLFAPRAMLSREVALAVAAGAFADASRLRAQIEEQYGPCRETRALEFLDRLEQVLRRGSPAEALEAWSEIDRDLAPQGELRARTRDGVFARLLASHEPEAIAEAWPRCLPALTRVLGRGDDVSDGRRRARRLVRDALLARRSLDPLDFLHDPPVADLLAEDMGPRWLACRGAVQRLWPAPPLAATTDGGWTGDLGDAPCDEEAALQFWQCLGVADAPASPEEARRAARRRMKQLHAELHGRYMRRAVHLAGGT